MFPDQRGTAVTVLENLSPQFGNTENLSEAVLYGNGFSLPCEGVGITCWLPQLDPWRERGMETNSHDSCLQRSCDQSVKR